MPGASVQHAVNGGLSNRAPGAWMGLMKIMVIRRRTCIARCLSAARRFNLTLVEAEAACEPGSRGDKSQWRGRRTFLVPGSECVPRTAQVLDTQADPSHFKAALCRP